MSPRYEGKPTRRALVLSPDHQGTATLGPASVEALAKDIQTWVETWNDDPKPFTWHKSADEILQRLADYCAALNQK